MRNVLLALCTAVAAAAPARANHPGVHLTTGVTSAGLSAGLDYSPIETFRFGARGSYFPGVRSYDAHAYYNRPGSHNFFGPEVMYLHDTVVLTDRQFTRFEWVALQASWVGSSPCPGTSVWT